MGNNEFSFLISKIFRGIYLWAKESFLKSLLIVGVIWIFIVPLLQYLQTLVRKFPYSSSFFLLWGFIQTSIGIKGLLLLEVMLFFLLALLRLGREIQKTKNIKDDFERGLNKWSIPINSGWTIQECDDAPGKMLSITDSRYPGTLKDAYGWYDYEITFLVKLPKKEEDKKKQIFAVTIRSENNLNGVMFQLTTTHFRPHLIYNGTFILDEKNFEKLPTILKDDTWIKVTILVTGNIVEINLLNYKLFYKIPSVTYNVRNSLLAQDTSITSLEDSDREIETYLNDSLKKLRKFVDTPRDNAEERKKAWEEYLQADSSIPPYTKVTIEYPKGSLGFRAHGNEQAYFRNVSIRKK